MRTKVCHIVGLVSVLNLILIDWLIVFGTQGVHLITAHQIQDLSQAMASPDQNPLQFWAPRFILASLFMSQPISLLP